MFSARRNRISLICVHVVLPHLNILCSVHMFAVIGGGPAGGCAAETLAKAGIETFMIERKLDNAKPCGGAIPLCMVEEFDVSNCSLLFVHGCPLFDVGSPIEICFIAQCTYSAGFATVNWRSGDSVARVLSREKYFTVSGLD